MAADNREVTSMSMRKSVSKGLEEPSSPAEEEAKVDELRAAVEPLTGRALKFASDACLRRYLRARNWNLKKSEKMLRDTLAWRASYKPEEIRWEEVAKESETGKVHRVNYLDKQGHTVLVMHPGRQNTTSQDGQMRQLVYCLENAILNQVGQEEMLWFIDFKGWTLRNSVPVKTARETANILQNHYPERLSAVILYNPPRVFEALWVIVRPFLDPKTVLKVKFVYSKLPESMKLLHELFDMDKLKTAFDDPTDYNHEDYAKLMQQDDVRSANYWKLGGEEVNKLNLVENSAVKPELEPPAACDNEMAAATA